MARDWETPSSFMLAANVKSAASRIVTTTVAVSITEQRKSPNAIGSPNDPMRAALTRSTLHTFRSEDTVGSRWRLEGSDPWRRMYVVLTDGADVPFVAD